MNVKQYFEAAFPGHAYSNDADESDFESMPLESNCGDDCKAAIDAGRALIEQVKRAFGESDRTADHAQAISEAVADTIGCFICG